MPKLPNAERAIVDLKKPRDYSLNPEHGTGKHKARVLRGSVTIRTAWIIDAGADVPRLASCYVHKG